MTHEIKVVLGSDIKREAVLIDPSIPVNISGSNNQDNTTNIIAEGTSARELLKQKYGR